MRTAAAYRNNRDSHIAVESIAAVGFGCQQLPVESSRCQQRSLWHMECVAHRRGHTFTAVSHKPTYRRRTALLDLVALPTAYAARCECRLRPCMAALRRSLDALCPSPCSHVRCAGSRRRDLVQLEHLGLIVKCRTAVTVRCSATWTFVGFSTIDRAHAAISPSRSLLPLQIDLRSKHFKLQHKFAEIQLKVHDI
jgi:hypothetical protein